MSISSSSSSSSSSTNSSKRMDAIIERKIVERLLPIHKECGYIYIISNPGWSTDVHKFGETDNIKRRFNNYNSHNEKPIVCKWLIVCTQSRKVETEVKKVISMMNVCFKEKSREWVKMEFNTLRDFIGKFLVEDGILTRSCNMPVYNMAPADKIKELTALYANTMKHETKEPSASASTTSASSLSSTSPASSSSTSSSSLSSTSTSFSTSSAPPSVAGTMTTLASTPSTVLSAARLEQLDREERQVFSHSSKLPSRKCNRAVDGMNASNASGAADATQAVHGPNKVSRKRRRTDSVASSDDSSSVASVASSFAASVGDIGSEHHHETKEPRSMTTTTTTTTPTRVSRPRPRIQPTLPKLEVGVYFRKDGGCWTGVYNGIRKSFSINKWGEEQAHAMASMWRQKAMAEDAGTTSLTPQLCE